MQLNCESGPSSDPVISQVELGRNGLPDQRGQVGGLFDLADLGPQALAGFAEPQRAWRVPLG